jgi:aprataxin
MSSTSPGTSAASSAAPGRGFSDNNLTALREYASHPDRFDASLFVHVSSECVVIRDKYPKAFMHLLAIPRPGFLNVETPMQLREAHIPKLERLLSVAKTVGRGELERLLEARGGSGGGSAASSASDILPSMRKLRIGLHAVPSLRPLHIHIITDDMCSPWTKTKKHYLTFASAFFLHLEEAISSLRYSPPPGSLEIDAHQAEQLLKGPGSGVMPPCHRCGQGSFRSFADLERHLCTCREVSSD